MNHDAAGRSRKIAVGILSLISLLVIILAVFTINSAPVRAFGGAVWLNGGIHYLSDSQISTLSSEINAPLEASMSDTISKSTPSCNTAESGYCEQSAGIYVDKELVTPAVAFQAGTPDTQVIVGYCTLCADGTFSPSCAVGRGACSYHGGVAEYNVAEYRTVAGKPEIPAQPAVYSYAPKTEEDSPLYVKPADPSLSAIITSKPYKSMVAAQ